MVREPEVLTVLFTDIVGSTELLSRLGDDAADSVRRTHFDLLRRAIGEHNGTVVKSVGDGLMVSFGSARQAVACAVAMQRAVAGEPGALGMRVGLDAGEPIHDDGDLYGSAVVTACRLCDKADGGQIIVSDVVRMLMGRRREVDLDALGPLDLKGLDEPVVAHAVRWSGTAGQPRAGPRIRLCGALAVEHDGDRLDERLPSRQARMLFALLALNHGRAMSRDALADALWPDSAPRSRESSLRALLTGVRQVFGPDSVQGRERVSLVLPPGATIDVADARAAVAAAERALEDSAFDAAAAEAGHAAELAAEEALPGLSAPWIDDLRGELDELTLRALEIEAQASLRAGRPADAERAARRVLDRAPYRESAHALLIEALAARGNLAEATLAYDRLRTLLRDELGTTPAPALVALHDRVIAGGAAPAPDRSPLPVAIARAAERPFVGRADEAAMLGSEWDAARAGAGRLVAVGGEPGIGKTSLTAVFARDAWNGGATVLQGRCHAEALVPYEPFVEALRQLPPGALAAHAQVLSRVMPELGDGGAPAAVDDDPAGRYVLFEAVARTLVDAARTGPLLLVLDDVHWADQPTVLLLRHLVRTAEAAPLLALLTYRTTEGERSDRIVATLADLAREGPVERIVLAGLGDGDVAELIGAIDGRRPSLSTGFAVCRDTSGNPLFVVQLLRHLGETGALVEREGELVLSARQGHVGVPDSVKELVGQRLGGLPDETVAALRTAAVAGQVFRADLVAAAGGRDADAILEQLELAAGAGLVEEAGPGQYAFVHALLREAIYEQAGAARRTQLHRRLAETLAAEGGAEPAELAHHYLAAGDRAQGYEWSVAAARKALDQLAWEDAGSHYRRAINALGDDYPQAAGELWLALGDALGRGGDGPESQQAYLTAAGKADALGLPEMLARAAVGYGGRISWTVARDDPEIVPLLERALAALGDEDSLLRVRLMARFGGGPLRDARFPVQRRLDLTAEALAGARRLGDPGALAFTLTAYIAARHGPDFIREQVELSTELLDIATAAGDRERAVEGREHRAAAYLELGDLPAAAADVDAMAALAEELRQPAQAWYVEDIRAMHALFEGRLADAQAHVDAALAAGRTAQSWNARVSYHLQLLLLRRLQGRLDEVEDVARAIPGEYPTYPICHSFSAYALAELGRTDDAARQLDELARDDLAALPLNECWLASASLLAETAALLGHSEHAQVLYERLSPYADRIAVSTPEIGIGSVSRYLGKLAVMLSDTDAAERHFAAALEVHRRLGARPWEALTLDDWGTAFALRDRIDEAARIYRELGMERLAQRTLEMNSRVRA